MAKQNNTPSKTRNTDRSHTGKNVSDNYRYNKNRNRNPKNRDLTKSNSTKLDRDGEELAGTDKAIRSKSNPYSFYDSFPTYAKDAATIPFATALGKILTIAPGSDHESKYTIPGLMSIKFYPVPGVSKDFTSPMNRSSIRFFTYLRSIQKASWRYDHQDVTMMITALDSLIMYHELLLRVYRVMNLFTPINEYYPRALVLAMGCNYDDLKQNMSDFRLYIDQLGFNIGQYAIPADIKMIARHRWLVSGLYTDSQSSRAQTYFFQPQGFWKYNGLVETGSQLEYVDWAGTSTAPTLHTFKEIVAFGDSMINAISNDQDFAAISGDLFSFYNGNVMALSAVTELESLVPVYDKTVLSQIENCTLCGYWANDYNPVISQNPAVNQGAIIFEPKMMDNRSSDIAYQGSDINYMNFHWDSPNYQDVMEGSRLMVHGHWASGAQQNELVIDSCGTEIPVAADMWFVNPATGAYRFQELEARSIVANTSDIINDFSKIAAVTQFDWAPILELWNGTGTGTTKFLGWIADIDNFAQVSTENLDNMHTAALYSMWNIAEKGARDRAN